MNLAHVQGAIHLSRASAGAGDPSQRDAFARLQSGDQIVLSVVRRLDQRSFLVSFGGEQHVMDSAVDLPVGSRVRAVVTSVGEQLLLRYVDTPTTTDKSLGDSDTGGSDQASAQQAPQPAQTLVATLESRYHVTLPPEEHSQLEHAVAGAEDPNAMALGGLYLAKLGVALNEPALRAMHEAQREHSPAFLPQVLAHRDVSPLVDRTNKADDPATRELGQALGSALPETPSVMVSPGSAESDMGSGQSDTRDSAELAKLFLNLQDGGSVGYRYGTLPVIVAGQLVELDLVVLQQRQPSADTTPVRRLVMSLRTDSFGQVRIDAKALDNRLVISFTAEAPSSADDLSAYGSDLRELLRRLGWNVEGIGYQLGSPTERASRQIIQHVLSAGTVDMVV
jgi:hypothetical protein